MILDATADLGGGDPFEQMPPPKQAEQRAPYRIDHHPGLVRQKRDRESDLDRRDGEIGENPPDVVAFGATPLVRHKASDPGKHWRHDDGRENEERPKLGRAEG